MQALFRLLMVANIVECIDFCRTRLAAVNVNIYESRNAQIRVLQEGLDKYLSYLTG